MGRFCSTAAFPTSSDISSFRVSPSRRQRAVERYLYYRRVFIAPPWAEIFGQDIERRQSIEEAEATYQAMVGVYSRANYELAPLPLASIEERVEFVLERMAGLLANFVKVAAN